MGSPQENFDKGIELRLAGNEAFKKQEYKQGNQFYLHVFFIVSILKKNIYSLDKLL
jgi:hypothetical protein